MIFLTIGTHEPFERLVRAVDAWCATQTTGQTLFGQITDPGTGGYVPQHFEFVSRLTPLDYAARFGQADLIVSHAGMGSILTALQAAKPIVILPRRGHLRETRNDHQYTTMKMLGHRPGIHVAEDETQLSAVLDRAIVDLANPQAARISNLAQPRFTDALRVFLTESRK
jgi:UDP-N-acetylglucosamine transferase subunit ALG13